MGGGGGRGIVYLRGEMVGCSWWLVTLGVEIVELLARVRPSGLECELPIFGEGGDCVGGRRWRGWRSGQEGEGLTVRW